MQGAPRQRWWQRNAPVGACYLAWVVLSAGAFWCLLRLREILFTVALLAGVNAKLISTLDRFGLVLLGLVCIAGIGGLESYLRSGIRTGKLRERIVRVAAVEAGFLVFSYVFLWVLRVVFVGT